MHNLPLVKNFLFGFVLLGLSVWLFANMESEGKASTYDVTILDESAIAPGINLFNSTRVPYAVLVDYKGRELHRWQLASTNGKGWHHVEPSDDGFLFAIATDDSLIKLDWNSNVIWSTSGQFHHDVDVLDDGTIYSLTRKLREIEINTRVFPIIDDQIAILSQSGEIIRELSLYDIIGDFVGRTEYAEAYRYVIQNKQRPKPDTPADVFHTNSLEVIRQDIPGVASKGDILLSIRQLDLIVVVNLDTQKAVWTWGKNRVQRQHDASILPNGNVLLFDNGTFRERSRAIELEPVSNEIVWSYGSLPDEAFFCSFRGGLQRLPNGNTLIANSDKDIAFEIDKNNKKVWSLSLRKSIDSSEKRPTQIMYRMRRLGPEHVFTRRLQES